MMKKVQIIFLLGFLFYQASGQISYPGHQPGIPEVSSTSANVRMGNSAITLFWKVKKQRLYLDKILDKNLDNYFSLPRGSFFSIFLKAGEVLTTEDFKLVSSPRMVDVEPDPKSASLAERLSGRRVVADLFNARYGLSLNWQAEIRDGSNYIEQRFEFKIQKDSLAIERIEFIRVPTSLDTKLMGAVDGSPIFNKNIFLAIEHPMSSIQQDENFVTASLFRQAPLYPVQPFTVKVVIGVVPDGQMRRGFLYFTERQRATPYHQFLHYNSWYDLTWIDRKIDEKSCLDRIQVFGDSLIKKRGVAMDAFLFDDGWDDNHSLWQFNAGFPNGFATLLNSVKKYRSTLGVWISPWGGYLEDKRQRLLYGSGQNPPFETNENGFSLAGPIYYQRFKGVATQFITKYDISIFKFDGVGAGNGASGAGLRYQKDIEALLNLITELRKIKASTYFNLTVGTWPSTFWLNYGDAIWRAGKDTDTTGAGSNRQKWITYHDAKTYSNVVLRAPLFPLNSVMYHGICIAQNGPPANFELNDKDIADEIWSFFGSGTSLQELYINPHLLNSQNWDCLAEAAKWAKKNESVLSDVHWVGGNPASSDVYGFAAWTPAKAVLTLRNPSSEPKTFFVSNSEVFELPAGTQNQFTFYDVRKGGKKVAESESFIVNLEPFEVRVFDVLPLQK